VQYRETSRRRVAATPVYSINSVERDSLQTGRLIVHCRPQNVWIQSTRRRVHLPMITGWYSHGFVVVISTGPVQISGEGPTSDARRRRARAAGATLGASGTRRRAAVDVDEIAVGAARAAHDRPTETVLLIIFTRQSDTDNGRQKI